MDRAVVIDMDPPVHIKNLNGEMDRLGPYPSTLVSRNLEDRDSLSGTTSLSVLIPPILGVIIII